MSGSCPFAPGATGSCGAPHARLLPTDLSKREDEDPTRVGILRPVQAPVCGGDEHRGRVEQAAGGRPGGGDAVGPDQAAVGREPVDAPAVPDRDPHVAARSDRQAVRRALLVPMKDLPSAQCAALDVELDDVYPLGVAVDEVHPPTVGAPADAVGRTDPAQHLVHAAVRVQAVEHAAVWRLGRADGADPEPPAPVADAVVEQAADLADGPAPVGAEVFKAAGRGQQPALVGYSGGHGAHPAAQLVRRAGSHGAPVVGADVQPSDVDVHPEQLAGAWVDAWALTELVCGGGGGPDALLSHRSPASPQPAHRW